MAKATIEFEKEDIEYYKENTPYEMQVYLSALSKGYGIDETLLYHVFSIGTCYENQISKD